MDIPEGAYRLSDDEGGRARRAKAEAQDQLMTIAEIALRAIGSDLSVDGVGEIRVKFERPAGDSVSIPFSGPGDVMVFDTDGECAAIYRDPPGASFPCTLLETPIPPGG